MSSAITRSFLVFLACAAAAVAVTGQSPQQPTFTATNRTVAVYATVTNELGRLVSDLPRERFTVTDNGKPQELTVFSNDNQPITVAMLLDRSGSMKENFNLVRDAGGAFVDAMMPADKARIGTFSTKILIDPEDFTSDHSVLVGILRGELQEAGPTPLWNAVDRGISALRHVEGRRVVLVFTDGIDEPMNFKNGNASKRSVLKRAEEEDVMIYAIGLAPDPGGPSRSGSHSPSSNPFPAGPPGGGGGFGTPSGGFGRGGQAFSVGPDPGLKDLATATGGGYFEITSASNLPTTFRMVANELHHQYALGFTPKSLDGKMHELGVKVDDAHAVVRARKRYLAEKAKD
jgi:VWFA-related protein